MATKTSSAGTLQHKTSRSISSLGGSAMQSYGTSMSTADKIVLSSVIGGTAEALGGGKPACRSGNAGRFANGAVTGAYVMMLNHLGDHGGSKEPKYLYNEAFSKGLAIMLKYTQKFGGMANPFFMADAIFVDGGVGFVGAEYDKGWFFVLSGDEAGQVIPYTEHGGGAAPEASIGGELGRVDLVDKSIPFKTEMLFGERTKTWGGAVFVGGSVSYSTYSGIDLISTSINIGLSANPFGGFSAGWNRGKIEP